MKRIARILIACMLSICLSAALAEIPHSAKLAVYEQPRDWPDDESWTINEPGAAECRETVDAPAGLVTLEYTRGVPEMDSGIVAQYDCDLDADGDEEWLTLTQEWFLDDDEPTCCLLLTVYEYDGSRLKSADSMHIASYAAYGGNILDRQRVFAVGWRGAPALFVFQKEYRPAYGPLIALGAVTYTGGNLRKEGASAALLNPNFGAELIGKLAVVDRSEDSWREYNLAAFLDLCGADEDAGAWSGDPGAHLPEILRAMFGYFGLEPDIAAGEITPRSAYYLFDLRENPGERTLLDYGRSAYTVEAGDDGEPRYADSGWYFSSMLPERFTVTTGSVNLRATPGLDGDVADTLEAGAWLEYLGQTSADDRGVDWYAVRFKGADLWISSRYSDIQ